MLFLAAWIRRFVSDILPLRRSNAWDVLKRPELTRHLTSRHRNFDIQTNDIDSSFETISQQLFGRDRAQYRGVAHFVAESYSPLSAWSPLWRFLAFAR
jgi:hypothetical protein